MGRSERNRFPIRALTLDLAGTLLLALGIYGMVRGGGLQQFAIAMIIVGVLLMMPLVIVLVQRSISRN